MHKAPCILGRNPPRTPHVATQKGQHPPLDRPHTHLATTQPRPNHTPQTALHNLLPQSTAPTPRPAPSNPHSPPLRYPSPACVLRRVVDPWQLWGIVWWGVGELGWFPTNPTHPTTLHTLHCKPNAPRSPVHTPSPMLSTPPPKPTKAASNPPFASSRPASHHLLMLTDDPSPYSGVRLLDRYDSFRATSASATTTRRPR